MKEKLKNLIAKIKSHPYLKDPIPDYQEYKEFKDLWFEMNGVYWRLIKSDMASYEDSVNIPHKNALFTSKTGILIWSVTHDINSSLLSYIYPQTKAHECKKASFDFKIFWDETLLKVLEIIENWISRRDYLNPDTLICKRYYQRELKESKVSIYHIPDTLYWRPAEYITSKEQASSRLESSKKLLEKFEVYDEEHVKKYGWRSEYHNRVLEDLQNEIDLLTGKIGNEKSNWLVIDYEKE